MPGRCCLKWSHKILVYMMHKRKCKRKLNIGEKTEAVSLTTYQRASDDRADVLSTTRLAFHVLCPCYAKWGLQTSSMYNIESLWELRNITACQTQEWPRHWFSWTLLFLRFHRVPQEIPMQFCLRRDWGTRWKEPLSGRSLASIWGMIRGQIFFNFKYFPHSSWNILLLPKSEEPQIILQACTPMECLIGKLPEHP